jgi:hypothetical protein
LCAGRGGNDGSKTPKLIDKLQAVDVVKVYCGAQFSLALTKTGSVYSWGKGDTHRLGHASEEHVRFPKLIEALQGKVPVAQGGSFRNFLLHSVDLFIGKYAQGLVDVGSEVLTVITMRNMVIQGVISVYPREFHPENSSLREMICLKNCIAFPTF